MRALLVLVLGTSLLLGYGSLPALALTPASLGVTSTPARAGESSAVTVSLADAAGAPLVGAPVVLERLSGGAWVGLGTLTTDATGLASLPVPVTREPGDNVVRASYAGNAVNAAAGAEHVLVLLRRGASLSLRAPAKVVDETTISLAVRLLSDDGGGVAGEVALQRRTGSGSAAGWGTVARVRTDASGSATLEVAPRDTARWRAVSTPQAWVAGATSQVRTVRNVPAGVPVRLPRNAPRPRIRLPAQQRAVGEGANPVVRRIPNRTWGQMVGRSWHPGCPVGRSSLRLVQVNYWDYDGYRRRGELVVNADVVGSFTGAFTELHQRRLPVRAMYRVDRFGWSPRLGGANDYASMAAGNTSVFNCRSVVNNPGVRSPHSWGRSLDLNTWENPYRSRTGLVPNAYWQHRSHPRYAWRSHDHPVVVLLRRHGFRWTYGAGDTQHFDAVPG